MVVSLGVRGRTVPGVLVGTLALTLAGCGGGGGGAKGTDGAIDAATTDQQQDVAPDLASTDGAPSDTPIDAPIEAPPGETAPPPDAADAAPMTADDVCRAAIMAQCLRHQACQGYDLATCLGTVSDYCPSYYFGAASNRTVAGIQACLPALAALTCTDIAMNIVPPCLLSGKGGSGDACLYPSQCRDTCSGGLDECGTCAAATPAQIGSPCDTSHFCSDDDDYCHPGTHVCTPKSAIVYADEGETCDFDASPTVGCKGDLICVRPSSSSTQGQCGKGPNLGEACADAGDGTGTLACGAELFCDTASGNTCQPIDNCGGVTCDATSFCQLGAGDAGSMCVPLATTGAACRVPFAGAMPELRCASGLACQGAAASMPDGVCGQAGGEGDSCDATHPCAPGFQCNSSPNGHCLGFDLSTCPVGGGADASAD